MSIDEQKVLGKVLMGVDVTEICSPMRVAEVRDKFKIMAGSSRHLTTGWDFGRADHRRLAVRRVCEEKPFVLIGCPPCTMFCRWQKLNDSRCGGDQEWASERQLLMDRAIRHVKFVLVV